MKQFGVPAFLEKCAVTGESCVVLGYKGEQVRDNIHSADLVDGFWKFRQAPRGGEVYNTEGGRFANCSMLEAIGLTTIRRESARSRSRRRCWKSSIPYRDAGQARVG